MDRCCSQQRPPLPPLQAPPAADPTPSDLARASSVLCHLTLRTRLASVPPPLLLGKLGRLGRLNAVVPGSLVYLVDQLSNRRFLVDTSASYSIFPHQSSSPPSGPRLRGEKPLPYCYMTAGSPGVFCWPPFFPYHWCGFSAAFPANGGPGSQHAGGQGQPAVVCDGVVSHDRLILFAGGGESSCSTHSHRSTVTSQQSPVISHQSAGGGGLFFIAGVSSGCSCSSHSHQFTVSGHQSAVISQRSSVTGHQAAAPAAALAAPSAHSFEKLVADFPPVFNSSKILPRRPSGDVVRGAPHHHQGPASVVQIPPPRQQKAGCGEEGVSADGEG